MEETTSGIANMERASVREVVLADGGAAARQLGAVRGHNGVGATAG